MQVCLNLNRCMFVGRFATEPELIDIGNNTKVTNFVLAVTRRYKNKSTNKFVKDVSFIDMEAWSSGAETIYNNFRKGDVIYVEASVKTDRWLDKESGKNRKKTKFRVDHFEPVIREFAQYDELEPEPTAEPANAK